MWVLMLWRQRRLAMMIRARFDATLAERTRIAQELHDTLLQGFVGVTMQIQAVEKVLPSSPQTAAGLLASAVHTATTTLDEARHVVSEMRIPELDARDLPDALDLAAREAIGSLPIQFQLTVTGERRRLPQSVEGAAFRVGREALINAVRHAQPGRVDLTLNYGQQTLEVTVRDDGRGIAPADIESSRRAGHWGIAGMRERATGIGGTCEITTAPEGGSVVKAVFPLSPVSVEANAI
jgi:signal transduction histidine kinase